MIERQTKAGIIQTSSGLKFDICNPNPELINIEDIADALSKLCRFGGHTTSFYSVAQHCCLVALQLPLDLAMWGLLHDASEAYLVDIPSPIKKLLPTYIEFEEGLHQAVAKKFDLSWPMPEAVKWADEIALATEARDLMGSVGKKRWGSLKGIPMLQDKVVPVTSDVAYRDFLKHYEILSNFIEHQKEAS